MTKTYNVAVVVGSIRKDSVNRKVANALIEIAPSELKLKLIDISQLELFNQDLEETPPTSWVEFKKGIKAADAVLFVTPEHNRSFPAALKNALDIGSRPYGQNVWSGKPAAVISASPGPIGGFGANHHLRQCLVTINVSTMPTPETYIGGAYNLFDETGKLINEGTQKHLEKFAQSFLTWIQKNATSL